MASLKITEKSVAAITPPTDPQSYYWDSDLTGFGVVVGRTGRKTFVVRTRVAGTLRKAAIGVAGQPRADGHVWTATLARIEAKQLLGKMAGGIDPNAAKRASLVTGPTLRDGLTLHVANMRAGKNRRRKVCSPRSIQKMESEVPRHLGEWLDQPIAALTAAELQKVCDKIERDTPKRADAVNAPGVAQANKIIAHVSAIWNALDKLHDLPGKNPATRLSLSALKPREARIDDGVGFTDWYAKVMAMDNAVRRDLQLVSLFTGIRSEGLRNLRWDDVDRERALLHVRKAKGDKPYTLPLVATVRKLLDERQVDNAKGFGHLGGDQGWVFPSISRDMQRVQAVAEVKERRLDKTREDDDGDPVLVKYLPGIHANRRTYNSVAIEIGIPPEPRLALMNHEGRGVNVKHYGMPQTWDYLRSCASKIEAALRVRLGLPAVVTEIVAPAVAKETRKRVATTNSMRSTGKPPPASPDVSVGPSDRLAAARVRVERVAERRNAPAGWVDLVMQELAEGAPKRPRGTGTKPRGKLRAV
ncbi:MAG: integrase family protein [Proteobacteria bacterium]|nr:integrase family protein [Pseudomonadota bacterium]